MIILLSLFLSSNTFNAEFKNVTIGSHNLHGFKTSLAYHKQCLTVKDSIWFAQELWLTEKQIPSMQQLNTAFIARSGMEDAVSAGILRGRPYGGVSIAWSRDLDHVVTPLANYKHKRVVAVKLQATIGNIILISVYMPFLDSRKHDYCRTEAIETIAMIDSIIVDHPNHLFIIGGDLNCELKGDSPFDILWDNFCTKHKFA